MSERDRRRLNVGIEKILSKGNFSTHDLVARIRNIVRETPRDGDVKGAYRDAVLYVEDNEDNIYLLKMRFELIEGYEINVAKDGREAVAMAAANPPDLILMDLNLPVIDGWEATKRLKADARTANVPVIALTSHAMSGDRERALAAGCDEFDTKPIDFDRLIDKMRMMLRTVNLPRSAA